METQIIVALIGTSGGLMGLAGTWLGAHLNRKSSLQTALQLAEVERQKHAHDRLWDARKEACTSIIVALNALYKISDRVYDGFYGEVAEPERFFGDESFRKLSSEFWECYRSLNTTFEDSSLILSDSFKALFGEWKADFADTDEHDTPPEHYWQYYKSIGRYLPKMVEAAKVEISPPAGVISLQSSKTAKSQWHPWWKRRGPAPADDAGHAS